MARLTMLRFSENCRRIRYSGQCNRSFKSGSCCSLRKAGYPITDDVIKLLEGYKLPKLDNFTAVPNGKTYEEKRENFFKLVKSLKPGLTEIIFHPSIVTDNLKSITGSWQQRGWEAEMFSDPVVKQFFADNDIELTNWTEIMKMFNEKKK